MNHGDSERTEGFSLCTPCLRGGYALSSRNKESELNYELVIFDWDGTLMDSTKVIASSLQSACADIGIAVPSERDALYVIGLNLVDSFNHVAPGLDEEGRKRLSERYRHHFLARENEMPLYDGVVEMLDDLQGKGDRKSVV